MAVKIKKQVNGNVKGKVGEREFAALLRSFGNQARRGQQFSGIEGQDVVCDIPGLHFEVKRREKLNVREAYEQAVADARAKGDIPVVAHRCNRSKWLVTMSAEDFLTLARVLGDFSSDL